MANYIDSYVDQRVAPFVAAPATNDDPVLAQPGDDTVISAGKTIDSFFSFDAVYRLDIANTTLTVGVNNITDEDPSFARLDLNYDPFTGDPIGRTFRVGLRQKF
jgi:iron complex outermembrane receptor protein